MRKQKNQNMAMKLSLRKFMEIRKKKEKEFMDRQQDVKWRHKFVARDHQNHKIGVSIELKTKQVIYFSELCEITIY